MIPFDEMWLRLNQLIKPNGAIVLFGSEPFSSMLRVSNLKNYKYDWIWDKVNGSNFALLKYQPMKEHEIISIFSNKTHCYYPIKQIRSESGIARNKHGYKSNPISGEAIGSFVSDRAGKDYSELRNPSSIQTFNNRDKDRGHHPTQKPVALMEYLIKTYTNEGELVLDFTTGSGTTCVAAYNTGRKCIGIEMDDKYFEVAKQRVSDAISAKAAQLF